MKNQPPVWLNIESFDCLMKMTLKYGAYDFFKEEHDIWEREVFFSELSYSDFGRLTSVDEYFKDVQMFKILNHYISIDNEELVKALLALPRHKCRVILMYYFLRMNDVEISKVIKKKIGSVTYYRQSGLKLLRQLIEEQAYE